MCDSILRGPHFLVKCFCSLVSVFIELICLLHLLFLREFKQIMSKEEVEILGRVRSQHLRSETTIAILESKVEELSERLDTLTIDLHNTRENVSPLRQKLDNAKQKILGIAKTPMRLDDSLTKLQKRSASKTWSISRYNKRIASTTNCKL